MTLFTDILRGVFIRWNGTVEWNSGMVEYWNSGMTTPTNSVR